LSATEIGTDGSSFDERGWRSCRWMLAETAIQCEDERMLIKAVGRYTQLPASRRSIRIYRWNASGRVFEQVDIGPASVPPCQGRSIRRRVGLALATQMLRRIRDLLSSDFLTQRAEHLTFSLS
jgi:hypothetical protein